MPKHIQTKTCHIESLHPSLTYNIQRTTLSHIIIKQTTHKLRSTPSPITHMETTLKYYHIKSPKTKQSINGISGHHQTKLRILNIVIKPRIAYTNNLVPFFKLDITKLDKALIELNQRHMQHTKNHCNWTHAPSAGRIWNLHYLTTTWLRKPHRLATYLSTKWLRINW